MAVTSSDNTAEAVPWREVHHLALAKRDLEATIRFYTDVLGVYAKGSGPANSIHGRHGTAVDISDSWPPLHRFCLA